MRSVSPRGLTAAAGAGMFIFGVVMALLGAVLPLLSERLRFDLARAGNLFLAMNLAMLVTMLALGPLMDRFGKKPPLVAGPLLAAAALAWIAAAPDFGALAAAVALLGAAGGAINSASNTLVADLYSDTARKNAALNLLGVFFGFGAIFLPFTIGALLAWMGLDRILMMAAALSLVPALLFAVLAFPPPASRARVPLAEMAKFARHPLVLTFAFLLFFESGNEFILGGYISTYLTRELGTGVRAASWLLALYWGSLIVARIVLSRLLLRVPGALTIRASALTAAAGVAGLVLAPNPAAAAIALAVTGLGVASIFPTTLGLAGGRFTEYSGTVFGLLFAVALTGGISLPWSVGHLAGAQGMRTALLLPLGGFLMIFILQSRISRMMMRTLLLVLVAGAACAADFVPMAVWYGGGKARAPMLEPDPLAKKEIWRRDLKQIRSLGFNTIRCWMDWASGEPDEGAYNFDTIDVLLEVARQEGLRVVIQVYMDAAPDWVGKKYPDSEFVAAGGEVMHSESAPGFCFDHPGVERAELKFFTTLAERAQRNPAFLGWDLWSEPHVINWATANYMYRPEFCFCRHSVARFRAWLRKKYPSLAALNQAWYRRFTSWEQVEPGRLSTILSYRDYIDWRTFIQAKLGEDLRMRYEAVKRGAPDRVATSHAAIPSLFTSPLAGDGSPDDWIMARQVDYYGTSLYPKHSMPVGRDPAWRGALLDFERSSAFSGGGKGFWVGELQAGFGTVALNVSATVTAGDLRIWTWSALARGAKAINYYAWYPMSTGYESGGFGLINLDGTLTERSRAAGDIARVVDRNQALFAAARPPRAQVAVVFNPMAYLVGGRQRVSTAGPQSEVAGIERDSWLGVYRALYPTNVPLDYLHVNELTGESMRPYKLVIFPYPLMIPEKSAAALREYVRGGGTLVAEARLGWNNENGRASEIIPGLGLHEVMGAREASVQSVPGLRTVLRWTGADLPGMREGDAIPGRLYEERLEPLAPQARVAAKFADGSPAAVISQFGSGKTLTLGSYVCVAYENQQDPVTARFFSSLLDWAGVERPFEVTGGTAEVRMVESDGARLLFVINHQEGAIEPAIRLRAPATRMEDLVTGQPVEALKKTIPAGEVWVVKLTP